MPWFKGGSSAGVTGYDMEFGSSGWTSIISDGDEAQSARVAWNPILGQWVHLMAVVDRSAGVHRTYINGNPEDSVSISGTFGSVSNATSATIGAANNGAYPFLGKIDDVRVYNRALSTDDVKAIYDHGVNLGMGLVGHWRLDETSGTTAADSSGSGNSGTLSNFPASPWGSGIDGGALTFDGTDDELGAGASGFPAANAVQTISAWFKYSSAQASGGLLAGIYNPSSSSGVQVGFSCCTGSISVEQWGGGFLINSSTIPSSNVWHHIAYAWDGTTNIVYLDGVVDTVSATAHPQTAVPDTTQIGVAYGRTKYFNGQIDDVRIYNRVLTSAEIASLASQRPDVCAAGSAGRVIYDATNAVLRYCNGSSWVPVK